MFARLRRKVGCLVFTIAILLILAVILIAIASLPGASPFITETF